MRSFIDLCVVLIATVAGWTERRLVWLQFVLRPVAVVFARWTGLIAHDPIAFDRAFRSAVDSERRLHANQSVHGARQRHKAARHLRIFLRGSAPAYANYLGVRPKDR